MLKPSLLLVLAVPLLFAPGCDELEDPEVARMVELCDALEDCDDAIEDMLAAEEAEVLEDAGVDGPDVLVAEPRCTHCGGENPDDLTSDVPEPEDAPQPEDPRMSTDLPHPDPPGPRMAAP